MLRIAGRRSSTLSLPLRVRVTSSSSDASARDAAVLEHCIRDGPAETVDGLDPVLDFGDRFLEGGGSFDEPHRAGGGHALGQRGREALGQGVGVDGSVSSTSRYSASLSWPTDSASPKLTFGRGEKPSVNASGSCSMRKARSSARATSRCEMKRTLPRLAKRMRTGNPLSPLIVGASSTGTEIAAARRCLATEGEALPGALAPAGGRDRRGHDVLERVVGAHPAVVAGGPPAVGEAVRGQGRLPVVPEEVAVQTGGDVVPREDLVLGAVPGDVPVGVEALGRHGVEPAVEHEALAPLLERAARRARRAR